MAHAGPSHPSYPGQGSSPDRLGNKTGPGLPPRTVDVAGSPTLAMTVSLGPWAVGLDDLTEDPLKEQGVWTRVLALLSPTA